MSLLLIGYMFLFIHRPFEVWPMLGSLRIEKVYMIICLLYWLFFFDGKRWTKSRLNTGFLTMVLALLASWAVSPYPEMGSIVIEEYMKVAVFYVLLMSSIGDEKQLRLMLIGYLLVMGFYMTHSYREFLGGRHVYRQGIVRMVGVDNTYGDPNTFAGTIVYSLPLSFPLWSVARRRRDRLALFYYTALSVVCILSTGSRGALVGLLSLLFLNFYSVAKNNKKLLIVLVALLPIAWLALPLGLQNRFLSLVDPSYGPKNAQQSAEGRTLGLLDGIALWQKRPITGFGPGSFAKAAGRGFQAHNLYGPVLGELGSLGAIALALIVAGFFKNHLEVSRLYRAHPFAHRDLPFHLSRSIMQVVALMLIMGYGGHILYRYDWMWFGAFQSLSVNWVRSREWPVTGGCDAACWSSS